MTTMFSMGARRVVLTSPSAIFSGSVFLVSFTTVVLCSVCQAFALWLVDTIPRGGGGSEDGGWVFVWVFPDFGENAGTPPRRGGCPLFWVGGWVAELGRPPKSFMGRGTLCHMGMLPLCSDLFCFTLFHFSLYMIRDCQ